MDHSTHNSAVHPVEGCHECDREIKRPLLKKHGEGSSTAVVPPPKQEQDGGEGQG